MENLMLQEDARIHSVASEMLTAPTNTTTILRHATGIPA